MNVAYVCSLSKTRYTLIRGVYVLASTDHCNDLRVYISPILYTSCVSRILQVFLFILLDKFDETRGKQQQSFQKYELHHVAPSFSDSVLPSRVQMRGDIHARFVSVVGIYSLHIIRSSQSSFTYRVMTDNQLAFCTFFCILTVLWLSEISITIHGLEWAKVSRFKCQRTQVRCLERHSLHSP